MTPAFATIEVARDFDRPPETVFDHWIDPDSRARWEAPAGSGMRYLNFDPREGGEETIEVSHEGQVIGQMHQRLMVLRRPLLLVSTVFAVFGGAPAMQMQVTMRFDAQDGGCRVTGTSQVIDLNGQDPTDQHTAGWQGLFDAFAADLAQHTS